MTFEQAIDAASRGMDTEQYRKWLAKLRKLSIKRDFLEDELHMRIHDGDIVKETKTRLALAKVQREIRELMEGAHK